MIEFGKWFLILTFFSRYFSGFCSSKLKVPSSGLPVRSRPLPLATNWSWKLNLRESLSKAKQKKRKSTNQQNQTKQNQAKQNKTKKKPNKKKKEKKNLPVISYLKQQIIVWIRARGRSFD